MEPTAFLGPLWKPRSEAAAPIDVEDLDQQLVACEVRIQGLC